MIVSGFLVNRTGKYKHIFKRPVGPNHRVALKDLYEMYELKCKCPFDEQFIAWLKEHKVPRDGWEFEGIKTTFDKPMKVVSEVVSPVPPNQPLLPTSDDVDNSELKLKARDIANLKVKDKPGQLINTIDSITKLRRALTMVNKKKGKAFLVKLIKARINRLQKEQEA